MPDKKDTALSAEDEKGYRGWLSKNGQIPGLGEVDKDWNGRNYDLRALYKKMGPIDLKSTKIPDEFKKDSGEKMDWNKGPGQKTPWEQGNGIDLTQTQDAPWAQMNTGNPGNIVRSA